MQDKIKDETKQIYIKRIKQVLKSKLNGRNKIPKLTNNNLKRHNNVEAIHHRNVCQHYGLKTSKTPLKHHPDPVTENKGAKVLWDFEMRADKVVPARRLVVINNCSINRQNKAYYYNNRRSNTPRVESHR